ncbi:hypothetical protein [Chryseobacterium potabilaquae]|uniref:DUF2147 domain-containing protein n=1 Tax=Chryseobacterium potabilaquae TaxID=2675057 RepID=A0A6N4X587_9FLAO|nr:hypothetical protein [Chryseobacterium potabilaquae]CAA7194415.1 hypothetical protein CHRY9293_00728 [Chryseobacterium potabilaquae]
MKKFLFFFILFSNFMGAQMPDISMVWLNDSMPYTGTIGNDKKEIKLKITTSEQSKKNDQEYLVSGYSIVDQNYTKFEGKFLINKYKDASKKGTVYGQYELAEEIKGKHSGKFIGKFIYTFKWNKKTEKIDAQYLELIGDWKSYDGSLDFRTRLKNQ